MARLTPSTPPPTVRNRRSFANVSLAQGTRVRPIPRPVRIAGAGPALRAQGHCCARAGSRRRDCGAGARDWRQYRSLHGVQGLRRAAARRARSGLDGQPCAQPPLWRDERQVQLSGLRSVSRSARIVQWSHRVLHRRAEAQRRCRIQGSGRAAPDRCSACSGCFGPRATQSRNDLHRFARTTSRCSAWRQCVAARSRQ